LIQAAVKQAVAETRGSARDAGQRMKQWLEAQLIRPTPPLIQDLARLTPTSLFADGTFRDALHEAHGDPELAYRRYRERNRRENPHTFAETFAAIQVAAHLALAELIALEAERWRSEHDQEA
jgi:hypothetical protein